MELDLDTHKRLLGCDGELRSAHIVSTYPVYWSAFAVLRDFLQNFFDESGPTFFASTVVLEVKSENVLIGIPGQGFALDWLTHIGASTKTQARPGETAGYFGEGFKIAALCAVRDLGWRVSMGSMEWSAAVKLAPERFGDTLVEVLAYHVINKNLRPGMTWLELGGLTEKEVALLPMVRDAFCYPENPWLGEALERSNSLAVYRRTDVSIPSHLPFVVSRQTEGLLFLGHQARGTFPLPFVIAMPRVRSGARDRPTLYDFEVVDALGEAARQMSPSTAAHILPFLRAKWRAHEPRRFKVGSWPRVVTALVYRISADPEATRAWKESIPLLLVCEPLTHGDVRAANRRRRALAWARHVLPGVPLVQEAFLRLGYPRVEDLCERSGGFPLALSPSPLILRRILALEVFVAHALGDLFLCSPAPRIEIMDLRGSGWEGIAETVRSSGGCSPSGRLIRRQILKITLDQAMMESNTPFPALATYVHERCHAFGGDASVGFSAALTDALALMASASSSLKALEEAWVAAPGASAAQP